MIYKSNSILPQLTDMHSIAYETFRLYLDRVYLSHQNEPIIPLSLGYPLAKLFPLPKEILNLLSPLDADGKEKARPGYGWEAGSQPLREAAIRYENTRHHTHYDLSNICIVAGGSYALNRVFEHIFFQSGNNGKDLIIVAPTFYRMSARASNYAHIIDYITKRSDKFFPCINDLEKVVTKETKAIFICNPTNPGYNYLDQKELKKLVDFVEKRNIYLVIDEVGDNFFHDKLFCHDPKIQSSKVIRICSSSKAYQLAEYRLGYIIADQHFIGNKAQGFVKLIGDDMGNPPLAANEAWQTMLTLEANWIERNGRTTPATEYEAVIANNEKRIRQKCNTVIERLKSSQYITDILQPDSSFNLTFQIKVKNFTTDVEIFEALLNKYHVSIVPCSSFGLKPSECYFRLTFAIDDKDLNEGLERILTFVKESN